MEQLQVFADGIWLATAPIRILGMRLTTTMTVIRLGDGGLLLYSPIPLTPARLQAVNAIGPVRHLYAPNLYHHLSLRPWAEAFPDARLHAPAGLAAKRPDLTFDREHHTTPEPDFADILTEWPIEGFRLYESVLIHRPTGTLIVADLVHNIGRPPELWTKLYAGMLGFYDRVALSRMIRWIGFHDRKATRRSIDTLLAQPFDKLIVGHGAPLHTDAKEAIADAYSWLR